MKIEEGFRPKSKKEHALDQAEEEEIGGASRPQIEAFTASQRSELEQLSEELDLIVTELRADSSKLRGYLPELEQMLLESLTLPHHDLHVGELDSVRQRLQMAVDAARHEEVNPVVRELQKAVAHLRDLIATIHQSS
jgi:hypothetical protein